MRGMRVARRSTTGCALLEALAEVDVHRRCPRAGSPTAQVAWTGSRLRVDGARTEVDERASRSARTARGPGRSRPSCSRMRATSAGRACAPGDHARRIARDEVVHGERDRHDRPHDEDAPPEAAQEAPHRSPPPSAVASAPSRAIEPDARAGRAASTGCGARSRARTAGARRRSWYAEGERPRRLVAEDGVRLAVEGLARRRVHLEVRARDEVVAGAGSSRTPCSSEPSGEIALGREERVEEGARVRVVELPVALRTSRRRPARCWIARNAAQLTILRREAQPDASRGPAGGAAPVDRRMPWS